MNIKELKQKVIDVMFGMDSPGARLCSDLEIANILGMGHLGSIRTCLEELYSEGYVEKRTDVSGDVGGVSYTLSDRALRERKEAGSK